MTGERFTEADAVAVLRSPTAGAHVLHALNEHRKWLRSNGFALPAELNELMHWASGVSSEGPEGTRFAGSDSAGRSSSKATESASALLTRAQVAAELGVCPKTVTRLAKNGALTPVRVTDRALRFRPEDIDKFKRRRESKRSWQTD